ncbi:hypothetical protein DPMN_158528 [Dreissena polymorpha]|uniref:Uncharacterized protein n=1 Tax=Dreissena polymorpha TaxID=45954 RepID=A0A9D4EMM1_DREPO|nr:hypothetical protein DPMN_158528 [Dreissena polymorpha]
MEENLAIAVNTLEAKIQGGEVRLESKTKAGELRLESNTKEGEVPIESKTMEGELRLESNIQAVNKIEQEEYERGVAEML